MTRSSVLLRGSTDDLAIYWPEWPGSDIRKSLSEVSRLTSIQVWDA